MRCTSGWRTTSLGLKWVKLMPGTSRSTSITCLRPERVPWGRSTWVTSPVITALEPKPIRVRNIFICSIVVFWLSSRMMNAVVQRAAAHVGQRRDLDDLALDQLGHGLEAEHLVERVVQRAQVGVDLLRQVAGQEAELLAGLHRRAHQQDAADLLALQRVHGAGHGEVGLAGAGRADAEVDVVVEDRLDVALLVRAARADVCLAGLECHQRGARAIPRRVLPGRTPAGTGAPGRASARCRSALRGRGVAGGFRLPGCGSGSPASSNWLPRLRISMSRRFSIWCRCSSNWPHRLAKLRASKGSSMKRWMSRGAFKVFCRSRQWLQREMVEE